MNQLWTEKTLTFKELIDKIKFDAANNRHRDKRIIEIFEMLGEVIDLGQLMIQIRLLSMTSSTNQDASDERRKEHQQYVDFYLEPEKYCQLLFFVFIGSANASESGKINAVFKSKIIHNHGGLFHCIRKKIGNMKLDRSVDPLENDPSKIEIFFDVGSEKAFATSHDLRNNNFVKSQPVETFKSACMIAKLHNNVEIAFVGIQRGGDKVTTNHLIHMLDLLIDYILDDLGIKLEELSIFTDGSTSENRNRTMLLYLLRKRRALFLRMLAMETGCPQSGLERLS